MDSHSDWSEAEAHDSPKTTRKLKKTNITNPKVSGRRGQLHTAPKPSKYGG